ncbi:MAG: hypothetical protein V4644_03435 [Patescibacteria group bacterium]
MIKTLHATIFAILILSTPGLANAQDQAVCTAQYEPVCGTTSGIYKTYGNACTLGSEKATYQHAGECTEAELSGRQEGTYVPPAECIAWNDGCNTCGRGPDGQAMCTLIACSMDAPRVGYCMTYAGTLTDITTEATRLLDAPIEETVAEVIDATARAVPPTQSLIDSVWAAVGTWFLSLFS